MGYQRGDVYFVDKFRSVGSEQHSGRPAVIVSNNTNNDVSPTVEIVYLTTQKKPPLPTHVRINTTGTPSTVLCEQVHTVDMQRLMDYCGSCTKEEMQAIDQALLVSLGLTNVVREIPVEVVKEVEVPTLGMAELQSKYEVLQQMYLDLARQTALGKYHNFYEKLSGKS